MTRLPLLGYNFSMTKEFKLAVLAQCFDRISEVIMDYESNPQTAKEKTSQAHNLFEYLVKLLVDDKQLLEAFNQVKNEDELQKQVESFIKTKGAKLN